MAKTMMMVELGRGYGDGYGVVSVDDAGNPKVEPGSKATHYSDHGVPTAVKIEEWKRAILAQPSVFLVDGGVNVPSAAIRRVIGPLDCPGAARILANRYTKNWSDRAFLAVVTDAEIVAAMSHGDEAETYAAMKALRSKYATA